MGTSYNGEGAAAVARGTLCLSPPPPSDFSIFLPKQPVITLEGSVACAFSREGVSTVTVQVSVGNTILQDRKTIAVHGEQTHDHEKLQRVFTQIFEL